MRLALACIAAVLATPLTATAGPSWTSAEDNVAYAVSAVCAPYVLDGADPAAIPPRQPLVQRDGWKEPSFAGLGDVTRVGFAGFVHVATGERNGARDCEMVAREGDAQKLREAILTALRARPENFAPSRTRYLPGARFTAEDTLCTQAASRAPNAFVLLSASPRGSKPAVILTLAKAPSRMALCDAPGVKANYRTLAPDQG